MSSDVIKVAILVDGGFFLKKYRAIQIKKAKEKGCKFDLYDSKKTAKDLYTISFMHLYHQQNLDKKKDNYDPLNIERTQLYRIFYYDAPPLNKKIYNPISETQFDMSKTKLYKFTMEYFDELKKKRKVALRLGHVKEYGNWVINPNKTKDLVKGKISINDLSENDIKYNISQKGVDIRLGIDIIHLAYKKLVDRIILISGDSDFVPAAKIARREGIDFILDPMGHPTDEKLREHIDGIQSVWK